MQRGELATVLPAVVTTGKASQLTLKSPEPWSRCSRCQEPNCCNRNGLKFTRSCDCCRSIHVHDLRMEAAAPSCSPSAMVIANAHGGAVNHVQWNPRDDHMLLSSGLDVALNVRPTSPLRVRMTSPCAQNSPKCALSQVFDIRHPANPVHRFCGHSLKAKGIYKPQWADCGSAILSGL